MVRIMGARGRAAARRTRRRTVCAIDRPHQMDRPFNRADVFMMAGLSTLFCAFLVLVAPKLGIVFLQIVGGLYLVSRALFHRARLRKAERVACFREPDSDRRQWLPGRYELVLIAFMIVTHIGISAFSRSQGLAVVPLVMFGIGLLLKSPVLGWLEKRNARRLGINQAVILRGEGSKWLRRGPKSEH